MYQYLEQGLREEYQFVRVLKETDNRRTVVMKHKKLDKKIVVKYFAGNIEVYQNLLKLSHPNLPRVYEAVCDGDSCLILQEYVDGITVSEVLESGLYQPKGMREVVMQVCEAAEYLHEHNIVHRDIKPENIMIEAEGVVKLIDYDAARFYKPEGESDTTTLGTIGYAAPEQFGITQSDYRTDIYSLGVLINVMLTGKHPSKEFCSGRYRNIVKKCTQINPEERYTSVRKLMNKL